MLDEGGSEGCNPEAAQQATAVLESYPYQDIRLLAPARRREPSSEGRDEFTKAMRDLL